MMTLPSEAGPTAKSPFVDPAAVTAGVAAMHAANKDPKKRRIYNVRVTGAAAELLAEITRLPGASGTLYEGSVVYHPASSGAAANKKIKKATSREMAVALAENAIVMAYKAMKIFTPGDKSRVYGVGLTAAIATDRTRKGADIVLIALATGDKTITVEALFQRGTWERHEQDRVCQVLAFNLMLHSMGLPQVPIYESLLPGKLFCVEKLYELKEDGSYAENRPFTLRPTEWDAKDLPLSNADLATHPVIYPSGKRSQYVITDLPICMIATSAHPFTEGHRWMADEARRRGMFPVFNIERTHPDKGVVGIKEVRERVHGFLGRECVFVTKGLGFYANKAKAHPNTTFAVGMDVARRLVDTSYARCLQDLAQLRKHGAKFLVFPRYNAQDVLETAADLVIPDGFADLFEAATTVPPPVSSTDYRAALGI